jgi:Phage integrase, N-terminal SAM-like domain
VQPTCTPRTGPAPWAAPHIDLLCHLKITFEELCQKWLDSRHDVREVTQIGYQQVLKLVRAQIGRTKVQDLTRSRIENVIISLREERGLSHRSIVYMPFATRWPPSCTEQECTIRCDVTS